MKKYFLLECEAFDFDKGETLTTWREYILFESKDANEVCKRASDTFDTIISDSYGIIQWSFYKDDGTWKTN